jgi:hypothetical protein
MRSLRRPRRRWKDNNETDHETERKLDLIGSDPMAENSEKGDELSVS